MICSALGTSIKQGWLSTSTRLVFCLFFSFFFNWAQGLCDYSRLLLLLFKMLIRLLLLLWGLEWKISRNLYPGTRPQLVGCGRAGFRVVYCRLKCSKVSLAALLCPGCPNLQWESWWYHRVASPPYYKAQKLSAVHMTFLGAVDMSRAFLGACSWALRQIFFILLFFCDSPWDGGSIVCM